MVGLRKGQASVGAALALLLGNPTLNPAVLIFIVAVFGWKFMLVRLLAGGILVFGAATLANRLMRGSVAIDVLDAPIEDPGRSGAELLREWLAILWWELYTIVPGYIVIVLLLGALRAWFFHPGLTFGSAGILTLIGLAIVGTLFVIPTAGEIPIVQTLLGLGLGAGAGAVLLVTLPAISLPTLFIVRSVFPRRVLVAALGVVAVAGLVAGIVVSAIPGFRS
ncbi:MAG: permease [Vulcanimicrobiaceae bacterium]